MKRKLILDAPEVERIKVPEEFLLPVRRIAIHRTENLFRHWMLGYGLDDHCNFVDLLVSCYLQGAYDGSLSKP